MARPRRMARETEDSHDGGGGGDGTGGSGTIEGEYKKPDAAGAFKIYYNEIAPKKAHLATIRGDLSDPYSRIKDTCNFPRKILDLIAYLEDQEDAKRDHLLLALSLGLAERKLFLPRDLVTIAGGDDGGPVVPNGGGRPKPKLVTLPSDGSETDLADGATHGMTGDAFEATDEELAQQQGRGGTAAAIAAIDAETLN